MSAFRDITLADLSGKDFRVFLRISLMIAIASLGGSSQFGAGLNGGTTDLCHLLATQLFAYARVTKRSAGVLFVDIIGASAPELQSALQVCFSSIPLVHLLLSLVGPQFPGFLTRKSQGVVILLAAVFLQIRLKQSSPLL